MPKEKKFSPVNEKTRKKAEKRIKSQSSGSTRIKKNPGNIATGIKAIRQIQKNRMKQIEDGT